MIVFRGPHLLLNSCQFTCIVHAIHLLNALKGWSEIPISTIKPRSSDNDSWWYLMRVLTLTRGYGSCLLEFPVLYCIVCSRHILIGLYMSRARHWPIAIPDLNVFRNRKWFVHKDLFEVTLDLFFTMVKEVYHGNRVFQWLISIDDCCKSNCGDWLAVADLFSRNCGAAQALWDATGVGDLGKTTRKNSTAFSPASLWKGEEKVQDGNSRIQWDNSADVIVTCSSSAAYNCMYKLLLLRQR